VNKEPPWGGFHRKLMVVDEPQRVGEARLFQGLKKPPSFAGGLSTSIWAPSDIIPDEYSKRAKLEPHR
jgi:hypothetical protein